MQALHAANALRATTPKAASNGGLSASAIVARMARLFLVCCLLACSPVAPQLARPADSAPVLVKLRLLETVSSANARVGQPVKLEVVDPVTAGNETSIPAGVPGSAVVTTARKRGHNRRDGQLILTIKSIRLSNGKVVGLTAAPLKQGSGQGAPIFGPCTFPFPADPAGLFRRGNNVVIPKGTVVSAAISPGSM